MNRRTPWIPLAALLGAVLTLLAAVTAVASGTSDVLLDALLQRPNGQIGTQVVPDRFLRRWDPVTVFFSSKRSQAGPEDDPERFVEMRPDHPGAWMWLDGKTLQFRPAEPWTPLSSVSITADKRTTEVFTLSPPPTSTSPRAGARDLSPVDAIELTFADPLPPATLARLTEIELRPLPGLSDDGLVVLDSDDFEVKTLQRANENAPVTYALVLTEPIGRGLQARVRLGLSLDTDAREAVHELVFSTAEPFRAIQMGCSGQVVPLAPSGSKYSAEQPLTCRGNRELSVSFNASPAGLGPVEGRNLVRFEPAVEGLDFDASGRSLTVRGSFAEGVLYRMRVVPTVITDSAGRELEMGGESEVFFRFERREPFFRWGAGQGIAERYGPKRVPIQGRGTGQVDVRIHEVDPLNKELWPFPNEPIAVDERTRPPGPGEEPTPLSETERVSRQGLRDRLKALGTPGFSGLVDVGLEGAAAKSGLDLTKPLQRLTPASGAGHYLVGVRRVDGASERHWMRVQVTDLALTTMETGAEVRFFVTSLNTGQPVSGAKVLVQGVVSGSNKTQWETLVSKTTDSTGAARWTAPGYQTGRSVSVKRIVVKKASDTLVLDATAPPETFRDGGWRGDRSAWLQWAFSSLDSRLEQERRLGHVFSERPIYRPEETVHLKGYVRDRFQGEMSAVGGKGTVVVRAPGGANWRLPVQLSSLGSFYTPFKEDDLPTGRYTAQYEHSDGSVLATTDFQVEAYRLPTFELDLSMPGNRMEVPNDQAFSVTASAVYYAGGKVANRPIEWRVTQFPFSWNPDGPEGFAYSSDGRYARAGRFDSTPALQREGKTDRLGSAKLDLDPGVEPTSQPRTYVIEATVTDADEQTVTATQRVHAVPAFVLGLKVPRHLDKPRPIPVQAISVGPDGKLLEGTEITMRLIQRQWHSVLQASDFSSGVARYVTDTVDVPLSEQRLTTTTTPLSLDLPIDEAGVYIVEIEARDALGRSQVVSVDLYAGGTGDVSWSKPEAGVFDVTTDENTYQPGQTAKLLVRSPFQSGSALVVIEAPDGNVYKTVGITGGKATVPIRIEEGWVPRLPVHVLLRRGRKSGAGVVAGMDLGKPETLGNTHWLTIEPVENTVEVALAHPERAMPGESIDVTVTLKDPAGKPLAGEVTLWLVDQAVLALATEKRLDPKPDFIPARQTRFSARDTRNLAFGRLPFSEMPGGDGGYGDESEEESLLDNTAVRRKFESVPYYEPRLMVGPTGKATVKVALPDNLTVFKLRAKAISGPERFGVAKSSIRVRLPVLVQPDLPRFVRPGDTLEVAALGRVVEGDGGAGTAEVKVEGLKLSTDTKASVTWNADEAVRFAWPVTVPTPPPGADGALTRNTVKVTMGAKRTVDGAADAVEIQLPLLDDRRIRIAREVVEVAKGGSAELAALEEKPRAGSMERRVVLSDHPGLVKMAAGMDVFVQRPARSTSQKIDRARAWIGLGGMRSKLGLEGQELVDVAVEDALAWLPAVVDGRGQVAAWPGGRGSVTLTADSLLFLQDASEAGYRIDPTLKARFVRSLTASLRSDYAYFLNGSAWYERSKALEALASAGKFDEAYFTELADHSRTLGPNGMSNVLLAAVRGGQANSPLGVSLQGKLKNEVVLGLFEGEERYRGLKTVGSPLSPLILSNEAFTVGTMTRSLQRSGDDEKVPYLIDALVRLGGEDGWGGRADLPAMMALSDQLSKRAVDVVSIDLGGTALSAKDGVASADLDSSKAVEVTHRSGPDGIVYASTRYIPAEPGSMADSRNQGFVVTRKHALYVEGSSTPDRVELDEGGRELSLKLGQVVEDHVQVINPEAHTYVAIEVPLAAGMELMNPNLKTASSEAKPSKTDTISATYVKFGDASVTYFFEQLPKGTFDFYFRTRATTRGRFVQPPAVSETVYDVSITGNSPGAWVVVE